MPRRKQNYPKRLKSSQKKSNNSEQSSDSGGDNSDTLTSGDEADDEGGVNDDDADVTSHDLDLSDVTSHDPDLSDTNTATTTDVLGNVHNMTVSQPKSPDNNSVTESQDVETVRDESPTHPAVMKDHTEPLTAAAAASADAGLSADEEARNPKPQSAPRIQSPPLASLKLPLSNYYISSTDQPLDLSKKSTKPEHKHHSSSKGLSNGHSSFPSSLQSLQLRFGGDFPIESPKKPSSSIPLQSSIIQGKSFLRPPVPPTGNHVQSRDFNHKPRVSAKNDKTDVRSASPFQKADLSDSDDVGSEHGDNKYTIHRCSCQKTFSTLYAMSVHLQETGHIPKVTKSQSVMDYPKLVRGQDMWLNQESEQTRRILRCMQCGESFKSLPMLTVHMMQTQHYTKIVSSDHGRRSHKCSAYCEKELDRECIFKCKVCHDTFTDMEGLANHMIVSGHHKKQVLQGGGYSTEFGMRSRNRKRFYSEEGVPTVASLIDFKRKCLSYGPNGFRSNSLSDVAAAGRADSLITCENCGQRIDMEMFVDHVRMCLKQKSEVIDALKQKLSSEERAQMRSEGSYHQIPRVKQEFKVTSRNRHYLPGFHHVDPKRGMSRSFSPREQAKKDAIRALKKLHRIKKEHLLNGKDVYEIMENMYKKTFDGIKQEKVQASEPKSQKDKTLLSQHIKSTKLDSALNVLRQKTLFPSMEHVEHVPLKESSALFKKDTNSSLDKTHSVLKELSELSGCKTPVDPQSAEGKELPLKESSAFLKKNSLSSEKGTELKATQGRENLDVVTSQDGLSLCSESDDMNTKISADEPCERTEISLDKGDESGSVVTDRLITADGENDRSCLVKGQNIDDSKCDITGEMSHTSDDECDAQNGLPSVGGVQIKVKREASSPESVDTSDTKHIVRQSSDSVSQQSDNVKLSGEDADVPAHVSSGCLFHSSDCNDSIRPSDSEPQGKSCLSNTPISDELKPTGKSNVSDVLTSEDPKSSSQEDPPDSNKLYSADVRISDSHIDYQKNSTDSEHCSPENLKSSELQSDNKSLSTDSVQSSDSQPISIKCSTEHLRSSYSDHKKCSVDKHELCDSQSNGKRCFANNVLSDDLQSCGQTCSLVNPETSDSQRRPKRCSSTDNLSSSEHHRGDVYNSNTVDPDVNGAKFSKVKMKDTFNKSGDVKTESKMECLSNLGVNCDGGDKRNIKKLPILKHMNDSEHSGHKNKNHEKSNVSELDHRDATRVKSKDGTSKKLMDIIDPDGSDSPDNSNSALKAMESFIQRSFTSTFDHRHSNIVNMMSPANRLCIPLQSSSGSSHTEGSQNYFSKFKTRFPFDPTSHDGGKRVVLENGALSDSEKSTKVKECAKVKGSSQRLPASSKHETKDSGDQNKSWSPLSVKSEKDTPSPQTLPQTNDEPESLVNKYLCVEGQNSSGKGSALDSLSSFVYGQPMTSEHPLDSLQKLLTRTEIPQMLKVKSDSSMRMCCSSPDDLTRPLNLSLKSSLHCGPEDGQDQMDGLEDTGSLDDGAGSPGLDGEFTEYKCAACSRQFASKGSYRYHLSRCHLSSVKMYGIKEAFNMSPYVYLPLDHTAKFSKYYEMAQELANKSK